MHVSSLSTCTSPVFPVKTFFLCNIFIGQDFLDPANMQYLWHKGVDFTKNTTPVHLIYRMATILDKRDPNAPRVTRELWKQGQEKVRLGVIADCINRMPCQPYLGKS